MKIVAVLAVVLVVCSGEIEDGIQYVVQGGKRDCFFRQLKDGDIMDFDLQVLSGGDLDISVEIKDAVSGSQYLHEIRQMEIAKEITMNGNGTLEICFDNQHSPYSEKVIFFDLGIDDAEVKGGLDHEELFSGLQLPKDEYEEKDSLMKSLEKIGKKFEMIEDLQTLFRSRYKRHRVIQENNLELVTWFSGFSCFLMVGVGVLQVYVIRNLFADRKKTTMQSSL